MDNPEDRSPDTGPATFSQEHNFLAPELNQLLKERETPLEDLAPLELLEQLTKEAVTIPGREVREGDAVVAGESPIESLQQFVMERLRDEGYGDFANLPDAISGLGPRLVRTRAIEDMGLNHADEVALLSMVVLAAKPDPETDDPDHPDDPGARFRSDRVPKLKTETNDYAALRTSLTYLREMAGESIMSQFKHMGEEGREKNVELGRLRVEATSQPDNSDAQAAYEEKMSEIQAYYEQYSNVRTAIKYTQLFLHALREGQISFTSAEAKDVFRQQTREVREHPEAEPLGWVMLPPEPTERAAALNREFADMPPEIRAKQVERIDELYDLVDEWGEGEVRYSQLRSRGGGRYWAAVLPQNMPDGTRVEHAVVDNATYGNARFVFRAEQGLTDEGEPLTWREVFKRYKSTAEGLGAKQIRHVGKWRERTLKYLTDPADEL